MIRKLALFLLVHACTMGYSQTLVKLTSGTNTSLRGLSVVNDKVAWASGSNGWVGRTIDAGNTWQWRQVEGYSKFDFRDIEAFSADEAIIVNAGSPAVILKTVDGGKSWKETYRNVSPDIFLDGMSFSGKESGIAFGDPINNKLQILRTQSGGDSWEDISMNLKEAMAEGEASFAASGTTIRSMGQNVWIATGGAVSRLFVSNDFGNSWKVYSSPMLQGRSSTGIFSIVALTPHKVVAVGGDYLADTFRLKNMAYTLNGGRKWHFPKVAPFGYRSSACDIGKRTLLATGPTGTDISHNRGKVWKMLSPHGFNSISKNESGKLILLAGAHGEIYSLQF